MANTVKLKRSAVAGKIPTTSDLDLGELGLNTYDGKAYMKKNDGTEAVVEIGGGSSSSGPIAFSSQVISQDVTFPAGQNGASFGDVEIASGITVEVPTGATWSVLA